MEDLIQQLKTPDFITGFAESRIGGRQENQDSFGYADTPFGFAVTVCDGMGGGPGGKTASLIAVREILFGIKEGNPDDTAANIVIKAIRRANLAILETSTENPLLQGMGSTCTVLLINGDSAIAAYCGDSRIYQLRGRAKVFRTFDHSLVFDLVRQKVITEEQARLSAQSNVITRALGLKPDVEVEAVELPYEAGDRFLLTTDGIHGAVPETDLIEMAANRKLALGAVTDEIATTIDGAGRRDGGGHDNLTLALMETKINSKLRAKMSRKYKLILCVISAICLLSIAGNVLLCVHNRAVVKEKAAMVELQDSLSRTVAEKNDVIKEIDNANRSAQQAAVSTASSLAGRISALQQEKDTLEKQLQSAKKDNKLLLEELDRKKKQIQELSKGQKRKAAPKQ